MKRAFLILTIFISGYVVNLFPNGVAIINGQKGVYLHLKSSQVDVTIENQVAVITTSQTFHNPFQSEKIVKYAFPLPESANATNLRWRNNGQWYQASISPTPQDTTIPGPPGQIDPGLKIYLAGSPLYFDIEQSVQSDSILIVELTYVMLLPYEFGSVEFIYPNDYSLIQSAYLDKQELNLTLVSHRTIETFELLSQHPVTDQTNTGTQATLKSIFYESRATEDYRIQYTLSLNELGLYSLSTYIPFDEVPDNYGGFFIFVAEPDPGDATEIIQKVFTLIVDVSGSMFGDKITQAKNAAEFIVNHLNEGDLFNIIKFSSYISSFKNSHVEYNAANQTAALSFISAIKAGGSTHISGAFGEAIQQFSNTGNETANIIIFFTDGLPTTGILETDEIVNYVNNEVDLYNTNITIFNFGIGEDVNKSLLTQLAAANNGLADFLGQDVLEEKITEFYLKVQSPVLLNTQVSFSSNVINEVYPDPLPNLYQGQQMIVTGRYLEPAPTRVTLTGSAFGNNIDYEYDLELATSAVASNQFLPKVWAKMVIENLLVQYYITSDNTEAESIKQQIITISLNYGVISPFTSYSMPSAVEEDRLIAQKAQQFQLLGNYPNPFNGTTKIRFRVNKPGTQRAIIKIYNTMGQIIKILTISIHSPGIYEIVWDGTSLTGQRVPSGMYFYLIDFGEALLSGKMQFMQ